MCTPVKCLVVVAACALAAGRAAAAAPGANVIRSVDVAEASGGVEIAIAGSRAPSYTVFKLQDPPRLVVDLAGADVSAVAAPVAVRKSGVRDVTTAQYQDDKSSVGRVIIALEGSPRYEVAPRGDAVVVKIAQGEEPAKVAKAKAPATPPAPATAASTPPATSTPKSDGVLSRHVDEASVEQTATAVTGARVRGEGVALALDGEVARFEVIELADPPRLAIDLFGVAKAPRAAVALSGAFKQARFGRDAGKVRVVLDAAGDDLPKTEVRRVKGGLAVVTAAAKAPAVATAATAVSAAGPEESSVRHERRREAPESKGDPSEIDELRFSQAGGTARIEISGKAAHEIVRPDARTAVLSFKNARLAKKLERSVDASGSPGPVAMMSSFNTPSGGAKVVLALRSDARDVLVETPGGLAWTIAGHGGDKGEPARAQTTEAAAAGFAGEAPSLALSGAPQRRDYQGRRITLDFHDIDIRNLLRLIADVSKKNIVVADNVTGKVTVSLRNVPWDQALDLVLKAKGLDKEEMGNVIRVAPVADLAKEQQARAEAEKARLPLIPLKVRLIPVNFARAADVQLRIKEVLTERGTVSVDERTNVLIVKDIQEALARAEGLVRNLDTEIPQVRIESRIVEASSNFNKAIGVQWGGNAALSPASGNPTGLFFPNVASTSGASGGGPTTGTSANPNYAVNLPAAIGQGSGGGVGFTFGSAGGAFNLNLRLSALENSGVVKTISSPSVSTIDNREATIGQGLSIPFSQVSASGVNTVFIEAKLELKVTPHVSADGSILMKIKVTNNAPNPQLTGANGQPSISKREAETEALVKDGETTVIGGIYTRQTATRVAEVPFFGKIPILGWFFRTSSDQDDHTELLIFITPRILNRQATPVASGN